MLHMLMDSADHAVEDWTPQELCEMRLKVFEAIGVGTEAFTYSEGQPGLAGSAKHISSATGISYLQMGEPDHLENHIGDGDGR